MLKKSLLLVSIAVIAMAAISMADEEKKASPADSITQAELKDHMYFLASDALGGRVVGSKGYKIAANYAASQFKAAGIKPMFKDADGNPTYFQEVPLIRSTVKQSTPWAVIKNGEKKELDKNLVVSMVMKAEEIKPETEMVFVGYGISEKEHGWDDLTDLDVKGKIAVLLLGAPMKDGKPVLPEAVHKKYIGMGGTQAKAMTLIGLKRPAAVIILAEGEILKAWDMLSSFMAGGVVRLKDAKANRGMMIPCPVGIMKEDAFKVLMEGEEYSPFANAENPLEGYKTFTMNTKLEAKWEAVEEEITTMNVVGVVEGTDEALKEEYVTIGGHLDHIPPSGDNICNGADDNASGSIAVMEIGEAIAMAPFKRSTVLALWAAEEVGLYGSNYFVNHSPIPLDKAKININLDMIARTDEANKENRAIYALGMSKLCPQFKEMVERLNVEKGVNWPLNCDDSSHGMGGSDHMNFMRKKVDAIFFFSGTHEDYHRPTDDADKIEYDKMQKVAQLAYWIAAEIGNNAAYVCDAK